MEAEGNIVPKELENAVRETLGEKKKLNFIGLMHLEVRSDKIEQKAVILTEYRLLVVSLKLPVKIELNIPFLDVKEIDSSVANKLVISTDTRKVVLSSTVVANVKDIDVIVELICTAFVTVVPSVPLTQLVKLSVSSAARLESLLSKVQVLQQKELGPCGAFSAAYKCMCDYHALAHLDDVQWDIDNIYLANNTRTFSLMDFEHLPVVHMLPLIAALRRNGYFTKFLTAGVKLSQEMMTELVAVVQQNIVLEELWLANSGIKGEFVTKLSQAVQANTSSQVSVLDVSNNTLDDKSVSTLCQSLSQQRLQQVILASTAVSSKCTSKLSELLLTPTVSASLHTLDLSGNSFKGDDYLNLCNIFAQPNNIKVLTLSSTDCSVEKIFGALSRGCLQHLSELNLSQNVQSALARKTVPAAFRQFFASAVCLRIVNLSGMRLPPEFLQPLFQGLKANVNAMDMQVNVSGNGFGAAGAAILEGVIAEDTKITALDISDNAFEGNLVAVIKGLSQNRNIKKVWLGQNIQNIKLKNLSPILNSLTMLLQSEDSNIRYLSLAQSKLKAECVCFVNALGANASLEEVDLSGNQMGIEGAYALAKALQLNTTLQAVYWDGNNTPSQGFHVVSVALERNFAMKKMPVPLSDASTALRVDQEKTERALQKIEELLQRNHSPQRFATDQSYRVHQSFLTTCSQQLMDKHLLAIRRLLDQLSSAECSDRVKEDMNKSQAVLQEADKVLQIIGKCHEVASKSEKTGSVMEQKLKSTSGDVYKRLSELMQNNVASMLSEASALCPVALNESARSTMKQMCSTKALISEQFVEALLCEQVLTDVMNKLSEKNLSVATYISEHLMICVVDLLDKTHSTLKSHWHSIDNPLGAREQQERQSIRRTADKLPSTDQTTRIEKILSVRVRPTTMSFDAVDEDCGHNKSRSSADSLDSPDGTPAVGDGPVSLDRLDSEERQLQHLSKSRPKQHKTQAATSALKRSTAADPLFHDDTDVTSSSRQPQLADNAINGVSKLPPDSARKVVSEESASDKADDKKAAVTEEPTVTTRSRLPAGVKPGMGGPMGNALLAEMKAKHKSIANPLSDDYQDKTDKEKHLTPDVKADPSPADKAKDKGVKLPFGRRSFETKTGDKSEESVAAADKKDKTPADGVTIQDKAAKLGTVLNNPPEVNFAAQLRTRPPQVAPKPRVSSAIVEGTDAPATMSAAPSTLASPPVSATATPVTTNKFAAGSVATTQTSAGAMATGLTTATSSRSVAPSVIAVTTANSARSSPIPTLSTVGVGSRGAIGSHSSVTSTATSTTSSVSATGTIPVTSTAASAHLAAGLSTSLTKPISPRPAHHAFVSGKSVKKDDKSHEPAAAKLSDTKKLDSDDEDFEIAM